jgi:lysozyme family protein
MKENFDKAINFLFNMEGYYSNDALDSGGETILGISKNNWPNAFNEIMSLPDDQKRQYAVHFYEVHFWDTFNCNSYSYPLDIIIFDSAVNTGKSFYTDGCTWVDVLFKRMKHYSNIVKRNPSQIKFLRGWINRVISLWEEFG